MTADDGGLGFVGVNGDILYTWGRGVARRRRRRPPPARRPAPALGGRRLHQHAARAGVAVPPAAHRGAQGLRRLRLRGRPQRLRRPVRARRGLLQRPRPARHAGSGATGCCVANPATRRQAPLPPCPPSPEGTVGSSCYSDRYLVFDPTVSAHYQVLLLPHRFPDKEKVKAKIGEGMVEWPPSPWMIQVFSSRTTAQPIMPHYYAACWHGALYLHFNDDFLMRNIVR
ncbi:hypothetical protein GQ55_2G014500 [Panicum hallii var. hallii]|uniref:Uncharacterized protein n=1 Tax=Panicum hallii var. hallii TaxID=1504633 RepID=A0A2T7EKF4_9POAL|nr:hypothetical protein GQ55_2G014500 [Panicum hallii var. hallii]